MKGPVQYQKVRELQTMSPAGRFPTALASMGSQGLCPECGQITQGRMAGGPVCKAGSFLLENSTKRAIGSCGNNLS